jgi:hypothetical protein
MASFSGIRANHAWLDGEIAMAVGVFILVVVLVFALGRLLRARKGGRRAVLEHTPEMSTLAFPPSTTRGRFE